MSPTLLQAPRRSRLSAPTPPTFRPPANPSVSPGDEEDDPLTHLMEQMEDAECADGCDWPDGPLSPEGCRW